MNSETSTASDKGELSREDFLNERELLIKEKEISLKELENKIQLESSRKNIWLSSPLLVAISSAVFGLIGTAIGATLQGYSNFQLKRQEFEFSLIQKALETEERLIADNTDRLEAAKRLLFLANSGVIKSLDSNAIKRLAEEPNSLPTFPIKIGSSEPPSLNTTNIKRTSISFLCKIINGKPVTVSSSSTGNEHIIIEWENKFEENGNTFFPRDRCILAARNFQLASDSGILNYLISENKNGNVAICASRKSEGPCELELFKIDSSLDPKIIISNLQKINTGASTNPLTL